MIFVVQNPFKVTEGVWREAKSWGFANGKHVFRLVILDYLSRNPVFSGNIPFGKTKIGLPFTFQQKLPDFCDKCMVNNLYLHFHLLLSKK